MDQTGQIAQVWATFIYPNAAGLGPPTSHRLPDQGVPTGLILGEETEGTALCDLFK